MGGDSVNAVLTFLRGLLSGLVRLFTRPPALPVPEPDPDAANARPVRLTRRQRRKVMAGWRKHKRANRYRLDPQIASVIYTAGNCDTLHRLVDWPHPDDHECGTPIRLTALEGPVRVVAGERVTLRQRTTDHGVLTHATITGRNHL